VLLLAESYGARSVPCFLRGSRGSIKHSQSQWTSYSSDCSLQCEYSSPTRFTAARQYCTWVATAPSQCGFISLGKIPPKTSALDSVSVWPRGATHLSNSRTSAPKTRTENMPFSTHICRISQKYRKNFWGPCNYLHDTRSSSTAKRAYECSLFAENSSGFLAPRGWLSVCWWTENLSKKVPALGYTSRTRSWSIGEPLWFYSFCGGRVNFDGCLVFLSTFLLFRSLLTSRCTL